MIANARKKMAVSVAAAWCFCVLVSGGVRFPVVAAVATGEEEEGILETHKVVMESCLPSSLNPPLLQRPCDHAVSAPPAFSLVFPTQHGSFTAHCVRERAPLWADRVFFLATNGYYNDNYFFRVIEGKYVQFGTNGIPALSNVYNYTTTTDPTCSILRPQPPEMPYCLASTEAERCRDVPALSNTFGTLSMSTSYQQGIPGYPNGVTWNATAELFLNIGDNSVLDQNLFVPICTVSQREMEEVVLAFPTFGEVSELGGSGPSLGLLYQDGNAYIESNEAWKASMAVTTTISVCTPQDSNKATTSSDGFLSRWSRISSLVWKGIAIWLLSWMFLN